MNRKQLSIMYIGGGGVLPCRICTKCTYYRNGGTSGLNCLRLSALTECSFLHCADK